MDINEGVPLPKKLEKAPEVAPGVPLPPKLTTPSIGEQLPKVTLKSPEVVVTGQKLDPGFKAETQPLYVAKEQSKPRIYPVQIERPVEESARMAGSGFNILKIKKDAEERSASRFETPIMELPPKIRALGNREEKVFEPAGSSIPTFVASENTQIKLKSPSAPKTGTLAVAKCGVEFEAPKIGQPMMRRVRIVWPTPMEKAPTQAAAPFKGVGDACKLQGMKPDARAFPGQTLPEGASQVELLDQGAAKVQIPMPKRPEPAFAGLQPPPRSSIPPRLGPRPSDGTERPSIDEILAAAQKQVEGLIEKTAKGSNTKFEDILAELSERAPESVMAQIATRAQAIMSREAKAKDLEVENAALREIVKTLGGKVALYEVELQILKSKKG